MASSPTVVLIGGGSTGTGIARDLAVRGMDVTLVKQGTLTYGTTAWMHGLPHSGGRYAIADRDSTRGCIQENRVLRDVAAHCVEMTSGLFVKQPDCSESYFEEKFHGCEGGVPAEVLSGSEAEPYLASDVKKAIAVPDGAVDPFRLVAASAQRHGARIETHSKVTDLLVEDGEVVSAEVEHGTETGVDATDVGDSCSGISATYGWKAEKYHIPMEVGAEMFDHMGDRARRARPDGVFHLLDAKGTRHRLRDRPPDRGPTSGTARLRSNPVQRAPTVHDPTLNDDPRRTAIQT